MANLEDFKLSELREMYPNIKDTSKSGFIEQVEKIESVTAPIEEVKEVVDVLDFSGDDIKAEDFLLYIASQIKTRNKILIKAADSLLADELFTQCQYKLFPKLNEKGISVMASSTRRDMHLNGTLYLRIAEANTFNHLKTLTVYNKFKNIV